jgi:hypothetical protein
LRSNGAVPAEGEEVIVSRIQRLAPWLIGLVGAVIAVSADAQNLDAGKSPAQIFSDTCSACHRNVRDLKRASAGFMRSHYTTSQDEAGAMASYLASLGSDPRAGQQKRLPGAAPGTAPAEAAKQPPRQPPPTEQAKGTPGQPSSKGARRTAAGAEPSPVTAAAPEEKPLEPAPPPAPVKLVPVLEPFEE